MYLMCAPEENNRDSQAGIIVRKFYHCTKARLYAEYTIARLYAFGFCYLQVAGRLQITIIYHCANLIYHCTNLFYHCANWLSLHLRIIPALRKTKLTISRGSTD